MGGRVVAARGIFRYDGFLLLFSVDRERLDACFRCRPGGVARYLYAIYWVGLLSRGALYRYRTFGVFL